MTRRTRRHVGRNATGRDAKRQARTETPSGTQGDTQNETQVGMARDAERDDRYETQSETAYRKTKRDERRAKRNSAYILNAPRGAPYEASAFSTMRKYNTQDRRTIASYGNIHNTNTNPTSPLYRTGVRYSGIKKTGSGNISRPLVSFCCCPFC